MILTEEPNISLTGKVGRVIYISDNATHYNDAMRLVRLMIVQLIDGRRVPISMTANPQNLNTNFWSAIVDDIVHFTKDTSHDGEYLTISIQ